MSQPNFYGLNISQPLSAAIGSSAADWELSTLGQLNRANNLVYLQEIPFHHRAAQFAWRVVDAYWSAEDGIITYFRAYDFDGRYLPDAAFGVTWRTKGEFPHKLSGGGFKYQPPQGNKYYHPIQNNFPTPNTGGYTVQVLDRNWPSEGLAFGIRKGSVTAHQALVITFRLLALGPGYPN
jgi:hypothetical protein